MIQDADNFFLGNDEIDRLYLGNDQLWPFTAYAFWTFSSDPVSKTVSGFQLNYTNGAVRADWNDGNISGIFSGVPINHTFQ